MTDYQRVKNNPYYLPRPLYRRMLMFIRDYPRLKQELNNILFDNPIREEGGTLGVSKPTENAAIRLLQCKADIEAVDSALSELPQEYRGGVFENIVNGTHFPDTAHYKTWLKYRSRFIYCVARKLRLV